MSLYRGAGGASDATDDSTVNAVAGYASSAASSATSAANSATAASTSASSAATSASGAATSASSVATNATNAASSASAANTYATQASNSKDAAAASATTASTRAGEASSSASGASSSAATATTKAGEATTSANASAASAVASAASAASALAIYGDTAAVNAAVASAAASASTSTTQAANSAASAGDAADSESLAFEHEQNAAEWASFAQGSANSAQGYSTAALAARDATLAAYDSFDDRYLGVKSSDPTLDNDGNTLLSGSLYFNSTTNMMMLRAGNTWVAAYTSGGTPTFGNTIINGTLNVSGTISGNLTGNVTGDVSGNAGTVTNGVYTTGDQTIAGTKTFSSTIAGSINGNANTVTTNADLTGAVTSIGNATSLGSFTSLQLSTALTDETGTGAAVFATSPTLVTPALGTPASGVVTNLTGTASININGTVGATTANTGAFTTLAASGAVTLSGGTANGVTYLNGSKVLTSGSALTFDGSYLIAASGAGSFFADIVQVSGSATKVNANGIGLEFRGSANPNIVAYNRVSSAYLPMTLDTSASIFSISGSEQMRLTSTGLELKGKLAAGYTDFSGIPTNGAAFAGSVGIGTSSPNARLEARQDQAGAITRVIANNFNATVGSGSSFDYYYGASRLGGLTHAFSAGGAYLSFDSWSGSAATERMRLDQSGNLGLGVTPSAWTAGIKAIDIGNGSAIFNPGSTAQTWIYNNAYYDSAAKYKNAAGGASWYQMIEGIHAWHIAPSWNGTGSNVITFTQAMTLDASGNLLVGKTAVGIDVVGFEARGNGDIKVTRSGSTSATTTLEVYSTGASAYRFYVGMDGTINATSTAISAISDQRLKENVRDIDAGLDEIMALKPRRFDWKEGKGQDKKNVAGFIAQEFETVFPECVGTSKAGGDGIEYKNINHETLIPTLVKAIQEQQAIIAALTARVAALEAA